MSLPGHCHVVAQGIHIICFQELCAGWLDLLLNGVPPFYQVATAPKLSLVVLFDERHYMIHSAVARHIFTDKKDANNKHRNWRQFFQVPSIV